VNSGYEVELSPSSFPVSPNDQITASVSVSGGNWTLALSDFGKWTMPTTVINFTGAAQTSAEWIIERPEVCYFGGLFCSLATLSNFGTATFSSSMAAQNGGSSQPISAFSNVPVEMVNNSTPIAVPGALDATGQIFSVKYA
jgi:hypothetical protein